MSKFALRSLFRLGAVVLTAGLLAVGSVGQVEAQRPHYWSGYYVGVQAGYHWGAGSASLSLKPDLPTWLSYSPDYAQFHGRYDHTVDGPLWGAQLGFNWRSGTLVFGMEADLAWLSADARAQRTALVDHGGTDFLVRGESQQEIDWLGTLRGRFGILLLDDRRLLVYLTGGLAYGRVSTAHAATNITLDGGFEGSSSGWEVGGTVGAGLELVIQGGWTLKAEYLYYDLGSRRVGSVHVNLSDPPEFGADARYELQGHIARVGLNYRLGGF